MTSSMFPGFVNTDIIRTGPADYAFLTKDTVIDLRNVHAANLSAIVMQPEFAVKGTLTTYHIERTNEILRASMTVDQEILDRILLS